jgi:hypothetical protein
MAGSPFRAEEGGIALHIRLTPKGGRDALEGPLTGADGKVSLAARVRAVPENGAANAALIALLAKEFGVNKSAVTIVAGHAARLKTVRIAGDPALLMAIAKRFQA